MSVERRKNAESQFRISRRAQWLRPLIRLTLGRAMGRSLPPAQRRRALIRCGWWFGWLQARGATVLQSRLGGRPALQVSPAAGAKRGRRMLYFHGGGYVVGDPRLYISMARRLAALTGAIVHLPAYRLAPEHRLPAAVEDALAAYRELLGGGALPQQIVLAGDSAGGGLALASALAARSAGLPQPAAILLFSPWVDLTLSGASITGLAAADLVLTVDAARGFVADYLGDQDPRQPLASPLFANLVGLPPLLIQVAGTEILLDDSRRLANAAKEAGVRVELEIWTGLWHVWQAVPVLLPEADRALAAAASFAEEAWLNADN